MEVNWVSYLVLGSIIFHSLLHALSIYLNISCLSNSIPNEFTRVYSPEAYEKSQQYTRSKSSFQIFSSFYGTMVFLVLWFSKSFDSIDIYLRTFHFHMILTGVLYMFILFGITFTLNLPISLYSTFILEAKYGFNKTTTRTFVMDQIKTIFLSIVLGSPVIALVLLFLEWFGPSAWIFCWVTVSLFILLMFFIAPKYLLPLFNKLTVLKDVELQTRIRSLADRIHFSYGDIFVMDGSKRSNHSNAFFAGIGSSKRIVLFDTLLSKQSSDEIVAILGHEMGHYKLGHVYSNLVFSMIQMLGLFYAMKLFISNDSLFKAFFLENKSHYAGLFFFSQILAPISFIMELTIMAFSRYNEYQADRFAVDCIDDPEWLVSGLKKLSVDNLANLMPHWLLVCLSYTHPPVMKRIEAIRKHAKRKSKND